MPVRSPVLEAINLELCELEAVAARMRELDERELLDLYPQIAAVRPLADRSAGNRWAWPKQLRRL